MSKRKLDKYLKNRDFAQLLEHGQKIAAAIGLAVERDTFNPVIVDFYERVGYLPEAIINYLALLGWSLDDRTEHFRREDLIESFSLDRVNKSPASFDPQKLVVSGPLHAARAAGRKDGDGLALPGAGRVDRVARLGRATAKARAIVEAAGDRIKTAGDIINYADFVADECCPTKKNVCQSVWQAGGRGTARPIQRPSGRRRGV